MEHAFHAMQVKSNRNEAVGNYRVERYTPRQALYKGVKMAMVTLLAAILSILLPGIHFVSVPLGILASPFVGAYYYRSSKGAPKSMTGDFLCPDCHAPNHVAAPRITSFYETRWVQCQGEIRLTPL